VLIVKELQGRESCNLTWRRIHRVGGEKIDLYLDYPAGHSLLDKHDHIGSLTHGLEAGGLEGWAIQRSTMVSCLLWKWNSPAEG
jgi:hypothetical protein